MYFNHLINKEDLFVNGKNGTSNMLEFNKRIKTSKLKEITEEKIMDVSNSFGGK